MQGFAAEKLNLGGQEDQKILDLHDESCARIQGFADRSGRIQNRNSGLNRFLKNVQPISVGV
jgi:hypothetical protein